MSTARISNSSPVAPDDEEYDPGNIDAAGRLTSSTESGRLVAQGEGGERRDLILLAFFSSHVCR